MTKILEVFMRQTRVGQLEQDRHGRVSFHYHDSWLASPEAVPLSQSLPLQKASFDSRECQGFFAGVLPEEENRKLIAAILGVSANNDFSLLEQIGGECAGAVSFLKPGHSPSGVDASYQFLTEDELFEILKELPTRPLMAGKKDIRLSLAGAQNKLAVRVSDQGIALPLHGSPSTHILKPTPAHFPNLVANGAFCMNLAAQAGLSTAKASVGKVGGIEFGLMERYDRERDEQGQVSRLALAKSSTNGKIYTFSRITGWRIVKQIMNDAQISGPQACPKGLRHTFGIRCAIAKVPVNLIQKWMGHSSSKTTAIYLDIIDEEERLFAEKMWDVQITDLTQHGQVSNHKDRGNT